MAQRSRSGNIYSQFFNINLYEIQRTFSCAEAQKYSRAEESLAVG